MTENLSTYHLIISGRVQGVGYRYWTVTAARKRDLHGWVRNRTDGTVEAVLHGPKEAVDDMIAACYKGPALANVIDIVMETETYDGPDQFEEKPTV